MLFLVLGGLLWWMDKFRRLYDLLVSLTRASRADRAASRDQETPIRTNRQIPAVMRGAGYRTGQASRQSKRDPMDDEEVPENWD